MTLAAFEQSGSAITVSFNMDTDRAGTHPLSTNCSAIFVDSVLPTFGTFPTVRGNNYNNVIITIIIRYTVSEDISFLMCTIM